MAYNNICPLCGAYLDAGERCTCKEEKEALQQNIMSHLLEREDGQIILKIACGKE